MGNYLIKGPYRFACLPVLLLAWLVSGLASCLIPLVQKLSGLVGCDRPVNHSVVHLT